MCLVDRFYGLLASLGLHLKEAEILFLGLDNDGKTTLLDMLKDERLVLHQPTQYSTLHEFSIGKIKFKAFDLGSYQMAHRLLEDYQLEVDAVVYLVDDREGFAESRRELDALVADDSLANVPFLILVNEFDIPYDFENDLLFFGEDQLWHHIKGELCKLLGLSHLTTGEGIVNLADLNVRPLEVFMFSIVQIRSGYGEAFRWLSQYL